MFLSEYSPDITARADVIIVGSGPAAMPIATAFAERNRQVLIIEGGDRTETAQATALTETYDSGLFHDGYWARHWIRALGGTSRRWSGWLAPLDARDLAHNSTGIRWPITIEALAPSYSRAATWLGRAPSIVDHRQPYLDQFVYKPFSRGTTLRIADAFEDRLATDPSIHVLTRHVVTRLGANAARSAVSTIHLTDFASRPTQVTLPDGVNVVLGCGGLGNAQVLLQPATDSDTPVGNESGLVGRFLMEHPHASCADVLVALDTLPAPAPEFGEFTNTLVASDSLYEQYGLLACTLTIDPMADEGEKDAVHATLEAQFERPLTRCRLYARAEQEPDPLNRIRLLHDTDWAGSHRMEIHNCLSSRDLRSIETTVRLLAHELADRRLGSVRIDHAGLYRQATGGGHTMGTTRMGWDLRDSVCDRNLRVHGYANLYLAGSSVFPTGGASNPTLSVVALSLRLADHLLERIR